MTQICTLPSADMIIMFTNLKESAAVIQDLDPLLVDPILQQLPDANDRKDVAFLINLLREILPAESAVRAWSKNEAAAATRDIGIILGSLKRHGIEPCDEVAGLETILNLLGEKSGLPPRDTAVHYTYWNPSGARERRYTHLDEEKHLIEAVRIAYPSLYDALSALLSVGQLDFDDPEFDALSGSCLDGMRKLLNVMKKVRAEVDPLIFARCLRPYFEPIRVNGEQVKGPGAVEMPLFLIDHFLWSSDIGDNDMTAFQETYLPRIPGFLKRMYLEQKGRLPLTKMVSIKSSKWPRPANWGVAAVNFITEALDLLIQFRAPHYYLAATAYQSKDKGHGFTEGSGGYTTDALKNILQRNIQAKTEFQKSIGRNENGFS